MNWKEFMRPAIGKMILFLILMGGLNYWIISTTFILDARVLVGLPLGFYPVGGFMMWEDAPPPPTVEFSWTNFIVDVVFWYLVSCGVIALGHTIIRIAKDTGSRSAIN